MSELQPDILFHTNGASNSNTILSNVQGVCPTGWHLPGEAEWTELETYLGGDKIAGAKLKEEVMPIGTTILQG